MSKIDEIGIKLGLSSQLIEKLMVIGKLRTVNNQEKLIEIGWKSNAIYLIIKGGFVCQCIDEYIAEERTVNFYLDNYQPLMTVVNSYFQNQPSEFQLKALRRSTIYAFQKMDLDYLIGNDEEFKRFYNQKIITALVEESTLKTKLISLSSENFYKYLVKEHKEVIQNVPSKYIAELMGITPQWLVKIKQKI